MLIRLQKILTQAGISSRRKAEEYILAGRVAVDGKIVNTLGTKADPSKNKIFFNGKPVQFERKVYILLNKPKGYICTSKDTHNRPTVFNLISGIKERVFTVGRLDNDTEGMLLLTNDGEFANRLIHPSFKIEKTYEAVLNKRLFLEDLRKLENGIILEGKRTAACKINISKSPNKIHIVIHEGRKRQVRRMFAILGYKVIELKRIKFGPLKLGNLRPGEFRYLSNLEVKKLSVAKW